MTSDAVEGCIRRRELRVVHAGVYQAGAIAGERAREMAAVLASGGVVSHRSAAGIQRLAPTRPADPVDITIHATRRVKRMGIRVYRGVLEHCDVEELAGVRVTTLPRTLFDFAGVATSRETERALAVAERIGPKLRRELHRLLKRYRGRRGTRLLRALLRSGAPALTRSEAEELVLELIRSAGLPEPEMNVIGTATR